MDEIIYLKDGKVIDEDEYMQRTIDEGERNDSFESKECI